MIYLLIGGTIAFVFSLLLTPAAIYLAKPLGAMDQPDDRKIHTCSTPRFGGMAVFGSFFLSLVVLFFFFPDSNTFLLIYSRKGLLIALALLGVFLLGVCDDIKGLNPGIKFGVQIIFASMIFTSGIQISYITNPFSNEMSELGLFNFPITLLWIIGITNAFNLIDGLDGLASGVAVIALLSILILLLQVSHLENAILVCLLIGSTVGFLFYNFHPAKIFLGDSGSLVLGFLLAIFSIESYTKVSTTFAILVPLMVLGLPIADTLIAMIRRFLSWFLPGKYQISKSTSLLNKLSSLFIPDRSHIHHQLLRLGITHRNAVILLYAISGGFGLGAIAITNTSANISFIILALVLVTLTVGLQKLRYQEIALLRNGITLRVYEYLLLNKTILLNAFDLGFIVLAFVLTQFAIKTTNTALFGKEAVLSGILILSVVCCIQLSCFWIGGLYRKSIQQLGIVDIIKIIKTIALSVIATTITLRFLPITGYELNITWSILDFYFLVTLILGIRIFFHVLKHLFFRYRESQNNVLIYGTGENGIMTLHLLLTSDSPIYTPLGFLDDNARLEGKYINGYPVYGGHWKLPRLLKKYQISHIFITQHYLKPEILKRIKQSAEQYEVVLRKFQINFEELPLLSEEKMPGKTVVYADPLTP